MQLLYYTRKPISEDLYAPKLADSIHLALVEEGKCLPLLHNSGIVYARAVPGEQGVLHPYSLREPWITFQGGQWHILARRMEVDGAADAASAGHLLHFVSDDLIHYAEQPLLDKSSELGRTYATREAVCLDGLELPEGCIPAGIIDIPQDAALRLRHRFITPVNVANDVPAQISAASPADVKKVKAVARYSDGSTVEKPVDWELSHVDFTTPGEYEIEGRIHQNHYEFPMAWHKADPAICHWNGKYYFISTNDLDGNHSLYIREANSIPELVTAQQSCILDTTMYPHLGNLLWAPEMHVIKGRLYIFHAGTPESFFCEQSHVMALKPNGNPIKASDWEMPRRVVKADGSMLYGEEGITLDMTVFWSAGRLYASWSQRQFKPVDLGAWLYIAELDPDKPWQLLSEPQVLAIPEYGWENNHVFVVEGPFALHKNGKIYLSYSGALVDSTYVVGMLSMDDGADPLDPASWTKENYPLLTSRSVPGEYGPGHNAYVTDDDGLTWNSYHARPGSVASVHAEDKNAAFGDRSSGIRRVHFNVEGYPVLDMTEEMDLDPRLQWVKMKVIVKEIKDSHMIDISIWLDQFLHTLDATFGNRAWFVGLQGSYSRGEATEHSDIDLVVILDQLTAADIHTYHAMLDTLPHRELICGFLSGKAEILHWDTADLFQFCHDTTPLKGSLDELLPRIDEAAVARAVHLGACNVFHGCVHNMLYEKDDDILRGLYKSASFVVQAIGFLQTGRYIRRLQDLRAAVSPKEQGIIDTFLRLKNGAQTDFTPMSEALFTWAQQWINQ